jgi:hypothetical protein
MKKISYNNKQYILLVEHNQYYVASDEDSNDVITIPKDQTALVDELEGTYEFDDSESQNGIKNFNPEINSELGQSEDNVESDGEDDLNISSQELNKDSIKLKLIDDIKMKLKELENLDNM